MRMFGLLGFTFLAMFRYQPLYRWNGLQSGSGKKQQCVLLNGFGLVKHILQYRKGA